MTALMFGGTFRYDYRRPNYAGNDRLIFSKGHASPLFYALWATAGAIKDKELLTYRQFGSRLEGHPRPNFPYAEAATGSLGQGLAIGYGIAKAAKLDKLPYRTYVLLGDSECAEGSVWETAGLAGRERIPNLVAIVDVNRLGQRGQTMFGGDTGAYADRFKAFGWKTIEIDGHDLEAAAKAFKQAAEATKPVAILAHTVKGKGIKFWENKEGWHGKPLPAEKLEEALRELGKANLKTTGHITKPPRVVTPKRGSRRISPAPAYTKPTATRRAFGEALVRLGQARPDLVVLDAEVANSTYTDMFGKAFPERFVECYIAEQHMAGAAQGLSRRGHKPVAATFAAFLSRAHDQIRMGAYSGSDVTFAGSHAGVSIGADGPSQMGLEDLALFRGINDSIVFYPSDAVSTEILTELAVGYRGTSYLRLTRADTPILYKPGTSFRIGGSHVLRRSPRDRVAVVSAGITLHEALAAADELAANGLHVRVVDLYSIKPLDLPTLRRVARETKAIITVEDHTAAGGIGEAVSAALSAEKTRVIPLTVHKTPGSGTPELLMRSQGIDRQSIVRKIRSII